MVLLDKFDKSEEGLGHMIDVAVLFEENHYLEAVRQKKLSEHDILQLTEDVRLWHSRMRKESLSLALFSEHFLEDFATDNNLRFHNAFDFFNRIRSTISGSRKMFRKFCRRIMKTPTNPEASKMVYDRCTLTAHAVSRDIFGVKSYDENVQTLYSEMSNFFTTLVLTLSLCHRMIRDEEIIRKDGQRCLEIYKKCRNEIIESARLFAKTFNIQTKTMSESELIEIRRKAKSTKDYAQQNYHRRNKSEFLTTIAYEVVSEGENNGLTGIEVLLFGDNEKKVKNVRQIISRFNELLTKGAKRVNGVILVKLIKWCGVSKYHEHKLYDYFCESYKGGLHVVGWTQVFNKQKELKNHYSDEELAKAFEEEVSIVLKPAA